MKFYFFGDSICFGQYISPHLTWVHKISEAFPDILFQNPSINGDITRGALDRLHHDVLSHKPDIVYIQFGLNDCNVWESDNGVPRITIHAFEGNITDMVIRCKAFDIDVILATNHPILKNNEMNMLYNNAIRYISNDECMLIDHEKIWKDKDIKTLLLPDGVHLSKEGHKIYYNIMVKELGEKLYE